MFAEMYKKKKLLRKVIQDDCLEVLRLSPKRGIPAFCLFLNRVLRQTSLDVVLTMKILASRLDGYCKAQIISFDFS